MRTEVILLIILIIILIISIIIINVGRNVIFETSNEMIWFPDEDYEDINIEDIHGDKTINMWYFDRGHEDTILFYHGSTGNISNRKYMVDISNVLDCNLLMMDYRGFGRSKGSPSQQSICNDGMSAYKWLLNRGIDPDNIIIWGESLGGAVATYVASECECKSLLVMCSFSSLDDIIRDRYPGHIWYGTLSNLIPSIFNTLPSKHIISKVKCPVGIMHSRDDTVIPYSSALRMYNAASNPKLLVTISGDHSSPDMSTDEVRSLISFCGMKLEHKEDSEIRDIVSSIVAP